MKNTHMFQVASASLLMAALSGAPASRAQDAVMAAQPDTGQQAKHSAEIAMLPQMPLQIISDDGPGQDAQQKVMLEYVAADAQVVKGKQYAADTTTETVQTLGDGNRIVHRTVSKVYRDSAGRTRREETFGNVDPENPTPHEVKVFIDDPITGTSYVLDPGSKSMQKMHRSVKFFGNQNGGDDGTKTMFKVVTDEEESAQGSPDHMLIKFRDDHMGDSNTMAMVTTDDKRNVVKEDLGVKNIEGVDCNGTRQTITIPAGAVGNEKPISIVTETWFAPSIAVVVQSTTDDPRYGKTTYQLTNVQTTEPARSLFDPPADFKMDARK